MKKRLTAVAVAAALSVSLLGVGTANAADDASLNVVHGIPGVDVNVCVNGAVAIPDFKPGDVVTGVPLPAGTYDFKIVAATDTCDDAAILAATADLASGKNYTAVAHLTEDGSPTLDMFKNKVKPTDKGMARLTVRHTAAAPAVDVWANGGVLLSEFPYGASATVQVPKGVYAVWASLPGDYVPVIGADVLKLAKGTAYQVYAWGSGDAGYEFAVVAVSVGTN